MKIKKSLGQNFLTDNNIADKIIKSAGISKEDFVLEIGSGRGALTGKIANLSAYTVAVEIDKELVKILNSSLGNYKNLLVLNMDILALDLSQGILAGVKKAYSESADSCGKLHPEISDIACGKFGFTNIKIVSNLPYYITTPVIMKFFEELTFGLDLLVLMMQSEVADRLAATPGTKEYGALTIAAQYYAKIEKLFNVSPECFYPRPSVVSSVVRMEMLKKPPLSLIDKDIFFKIVRSAFGQRRKTLLNALTSSLKQDRAGITYLLESSGIDPRRRGETLSSLEFANLSNNYCRMFLD